MIAGGLSNPLRLRLVFGLWFVSFGLSLGRFATFQIGPQRRRKPGRLVICLGWLGHDCILSDSRAFH